MDDSRQSKSFRSVVYISLLLSISSQSFGADSMAALSEGDTASEGLQSYAVSGKGRVARAQEGWSLRRIAKAIGTAALYASGQALSGTQQAMVEFSGQSGSGVAPFLLGTTVLTLPSYVGGQPMNLEGDQGILHPSTYGEDQATPVSPAPALRRTLPPKAPTAPAAVTIDGGGRLECSLPVTHSSTDGSTILLEVGEITDEHKDHLRQLYTHYLSTRSLRIKQNSFQTIRDYICEFSARDQKELVQYLRSLMSQGDISPEDPLEQFLYRIAGADGAGAGGMDEEDKSEEEDEDECEEEGEMASASGSSPSASVNTMLAGIEGRSTAREVPGIVNYVPTASFCYRHRLIRVGFNSEERKRMHALTQRIKRKHFAVVRDTANLAKALFSIVGVVNKEREEVEVTGHHFTPETFYSKAHHSESNFVSYFVSAWDTKDSSYEGRTYDFKEFVLMM